MPTYSYKCSDCENVTERVQSVSQYNNCPKCKCGGDTRLVILTAPKGFVQSDIAYKCVATGETITSRRQRREVMKRHDLVDAN